MITKEEALHAMAGHPDLAEIYELEHDRMHFLLGLAHECIDVGDTKQYILPDLKMYATRLVGPDAVHVQLRTARHAEMLMAFIDWLLPEETQGYPEKKGELTHANE